MEVYEKEVRARLHAKSKSAPKSFWSDTDSDENSRNVSDEEMTEKYPVEDIEDNEFESDRKNESEGESLGEEMENRWTTEAEDFQKNFKSSIRMRLKANYSKPIDLYSEARKIEREKIEKRLKWEQRIRSDFFFVISTSTDFYTGKCFTLMWDPYKLCDSLFSFR